jgi:phosphoenolpyruvate carboxykinase (ATP)
MIKAILEGELNDVETQADPIFGVHVPLAVNGVPSEILHPRNTWKKKAAYDEKARELAIQFVENFKEYENDVDKKIKDASPNPSGMSKNGSGKIHELRK